MADKPSFEDLWNGLKKAVLQMWEDLSGAFYYAFASNRPVEEIKPVVNSPWPGEPTGNTFTDTWGIPGGYGDEGPPTKQQSRMVVQRYAGRDSTAHHVGTNGNMLGYGGSYGYYPTGSGYRNTEFSTREHSASAQRIRTGNDPQVDKENRKEQSEFADSETNKQVAKIDQRIREGNMQTVDAAMQSNLRFEHKHKQAMIVAAASVGLDGSEKFRDVSEGTVIGIRDEMFSVLSTERPGGRPPVFVGGNDDDARSAGIILLKNEKLARQHNNVEAFTILLDRGMTVDEPYLARMMKAVEGDQKKKEELIALLKDRGIIEEKDEKFSVIAPDMGKALAQFHSGAHAVESNAALPSPLKDKGTALQA